MSMRNHYAFGFTRLRNDWACTRYYLEAMRTDGFDPAVSVADLTLENFLAYGCMRACAHAGDRAMSKRWNKLWRFQNAIIGAVNNSLAVAFPMVGE